MYRTADGTSIITSSSESNQISTFVLPETLLEQREQPLSLDPQHKIYLPEPTNVVAPAPFFSLPYPQTHTLLVACRDHPIQLFQALPPTDPNDTPSPTPDDTSGALPAVSRPLSAYNLTSATTEAYLPITSLIWPSPGTHFIAASTNVIAQFDVTRTGSAPTRLVRTIPSTRHIAKGNGIGMRGTVSALSAQPEENSLVAAGTWTRWVGLYDFARAGESVSTWGVTGAAASCTGDDAVPRTGGNGKNVKGIGGQGILQTIWSPCGRYLLVNERQSTGILVYDVRVTGKLLGWLAGRDALTHQRLSCNVYTGLPDVGGFEVWAGTQDGTVKVWEGVGNSEGAMKPSWEWDTHDGGEGSIGSVAMHSSGSVLATCSGSWGFPSDDGEDSDASSSSSSSASSDDDSDDGDNSNNHKEARRTTHSRLKIWSIGANSKPDAHPQDNLDQP